MFRWMRVLSSLLLGGVVGTLLTPLPSQAQSVTIDGAPVTISRTSTACTSGYNICSFIPAKQYGGWIVRDVSLTNRARIMLADNSSSTTLDLLKLTGIMLVPASTTATTTKTLRIVVTYLYSGAQPAGDYSWAYGMAGYLDPSSTENVAGDQLKQIGQGNFAGSIVALGAGLDTGKFVSPTAFNLNGSVSKTRAAVVVKPGCNTGSAKCAPTITQTFTLTVTGNDTLVLTDSVIAAGGTCRPVEPGTLLAPSNLYALMLRLDPKAPRDLNLMSEWQVRMGEKYAENASQKKLLTFVVREMEKWLAANAAGTCPHVEAQANAVVAADAQAALVEVAAAGPFEVAKTGAGTSVASFTGLGDISGGPFSSSAKDVSSDGSVVVGRGWGSGDPEASRWTDGIGMVSLAPGVFGQSEVVSSDGAVVVGWTLDASTALPHAFRWTQGTGPVDLGTLLSIPGQFSDSIAFDASANGQVVVGTSTHVLADGAVAIEAFRWEDDSMVGLGTLPGAPSFESRATAVSADGSVIIGMAINSSGLTELVRWTATSGIYNIQGLGIVNAQATAVSGNGSIIVGSISNGLNTDAFRWSQTTGLEILPGLPGAESGDRSSANDVSADGSIIVGRAMNSLGDPNAVIWHKDSSGVWTIRMLKDDVLDADLWQLHEAHGISPDGRIIVGDGFSLADQGTGAWKIQLP